MAGGHHEYDLGGLGGASVHHCGLRRAATTIALGHGLAAAPAIATSKQWRTLSRQAVQTRGVHCSRRNLEHFHSRVSISGSADGAVSAGQEASP